MQCSSRIQDAWHSVSRLGLRCMFFSVVHTRTAVVDDKSLRRWRLLRTVWPVTSGGVRNQAPRRCVSLNHVSWSSFHGPERRRTHSISHFLSGVAEGIPSGNHPAASCDPSLFTDLINRLQVETSSEASHNLNCVKEMSKVIEISRPMLSSNLPNLKWPWPNPLFDRARRRSSRCSIDGFCCPFAVDEGCHCGTKEWPSIKDVWVNLSANRPRSIFLSRPTNPQSKPSPSCRKPLMM